MVEILVYTFENFPQINELKNNFGDVFIFKKLREDIDSFCKKIIEVKPKLILGVAKSKKYSYFEPLTINRFNKSKKVINSLNEEFILDIPNLNNTNFLIRKRPTTSFCNYSMYKIKNFLEENGLEIPFSFVHIKQQDIKLLPNLLNKNFF
ncbi:MAG: hypothetical protein QT05_C0024G0014 [archaeon GW2011_AR13]|nr:MAG: hypothetical protein QT05_C0024G0014 [archaeon GW2011_AR13]HIG94684.1 hypothetical protein [Nanoarchaeota archaeon]HIH63480.1 hypothetical protein [Nanoarchaeota archaeon]HIJ09410.1 hypothetical protein [Nanoarchaeota archaeon]